MTTSPITSPSTNQPTLSPTIKPTSVPTSSPTSKPVTIPPTASPTAEPVSIPTIRPTLRKRLPTRGPIIVPVASLQPTSVPTKSPTVQPTNCPTVQVPVKPSGCFSRVNTVEVVGKGLVVVKELQVVDKVKDAGGKMVNVYSFGHYQPNGTTDYLQIFVQGQVKPLEVTGDHLVFVNGSATPASTVALGDFVNLGTAAGAITRGMVHKIGVVRRTGIYAPFTTSGTIVVSGVAASSYVTLQEDSAVLLLGHYRTLLSMHWLEHVFQTPHRLFCSTVGVARCRQFEKYNQEGISNWAEGPYNVAKWLLRQNGIVTTVAFLVALFLVLMLYGVELGGLYLFLALVAGAFYVCQLQKKGKKGTM